MLDTVVLRGKHLLKEPIVWLLMTLVFCLSFYSYLPEWFVRSALTVSVILKGLLMFFIPLLILSGTALAFSSLKGNGFLFIVMLIGMILISNFISLTVSSLVGCCIISFTATFTDDFGARRRRCERYRQYILQFIEMDEYRSHPAQGNDVVFGQSFHSLFAAFPHGFYFKAPARRANEHLPKIKRRGVRGDDCVYFAGFNGVVGRGT